MRHVLRYFSPLAGEGGRYARQPRVLGLMQQQSPLQLAPYQRKWSSGRNLLGLVGSFTAPLELCFGERARTVDVDRSRELLNTQNLLLVAWWTRRQ